MSKGSSRRPGFILPGAWEQIFSKPSKCPVCHENATRCVCYGTDDGPGQDGEEWAEVKPYERRKHNREGV